MAHDLERARVEEGGGIEGAEDRGRAGAHVVPELEAEPVRRRERCRDAELPPRQFVVFPESLRDLCPERADQGTIERREQRVVVQQGVVDIDCADDLGDHVRHIVPCASVGCYVADMARIIGIDFDNTIVSYDALIARIAVEQRWIPGSLAGGTKKMLRDRLLRGPGGQEKWTSLQALAYGERIGEAPPVPGVLEFLAGCRAAGIEVHVISHKTRVAAADRRIDLRTAAHHWMEEHGLFRPGIGLSPERVHFEESRRAKLERIRHLGCDLFIDDLEETFAEPDFPTGVERILLGPPSSSVPHGTIALPDWTAVRTHLFGPTDGGDLRSRLASLLGQVPREVQFMAGGRNNRLYLVETHDRRYVAKHYFQRAAGGWDRLAVEYEGLRFLRSAGIEEVPCPIGRDDDGAVAVYEHVEGARITRSEVGEADLAQVARFVTLLRTAGMRPEAGRLNAAAEACFSVDAALRSVQRRFDMLTVARDEDAALDRFLTDEFVPVLSAATDHARDGSFAMGSDPAEVTPEGHRVLSPSDFGFHNVLRRPNGRLVFLDLEYFGWDDATKMISDFLLQPVIILDAAQRRRSLELLCAAFPEPGLLRGRVKVVYPVFALKWALIYLNEFLPERQMRRRFVDPAFDIVVAKRTQLEKARAVMRRVLSEDGRSISVVDL